MIGDFQFKLVEYNAMLLKKAEKQLKKIYKNDLTIKIEKNIQQNIENQ